MGSADSSGATARPAGLAVDAAVGLGLCAVFLGRAIPGPAWEGLTWQVLAVAGLAGGSLVTRRRWPLAALAQAVGGGVLAMPVSLANSAVDALVGGGLLVATAARWARGRAGRRSPATAAGWWARPGPGWWRLPALAAATVAGVLVAPVDLKESAAVAVLLAAYTVGSATDRRTVVVAGAAAAAALAVGGTLASPDAWTGPDTPVPLIAVALVGVAVGDAVRSRRELVAASVERTRRVEQALAEENRRRLVEERLRIAREVHDLVAHHIAVVSMQAGVASHQLRDRPDEAAAALRHVRAASRTVLGELGTLLSVLREADDPADPVEPAPRLADLDRLLGSFAAAGLRVDPVVSGTPRAVPPMIDLAGYRVIQECLTNAHKHGTGRAELQLSYTDDRLVIDVRNPYRDRDQAPAEPGTGYGLQGMRERLVAVGGSVAAGPAGDGSFVVTAQLPLPVGDVRAAGDQENR